MATLNLSSNGPSISKSYQNIINSSLPSVSATGSPTYCQWAVFSVSTPLVSAFQHDAGNTESILKVQATGEGELTDLIEEFSEGKIQFAFAKVTDPNTGLPKHVLIAWCGEGVPERTKGYFTSHLSAVSRYLHGYHVQLTARSDGDLTTEGIMQKVADASGAKYTAGNDQPVSAAPKHPTSNKPVFTPSRTGGIGSKATPAAPRRETPTGESDDGWGPDAPPVTRSQLEKVQSAYKPTRVNIQELRSEKQSGVGANTENVPDGRRDIVKGDYQPVGKVDIAAIRRQARETGNIQDDRPAPVKGAYEPVGKVDIAAIRSKAQTPNDSSATPDRDFATANTQTPSQAKPSNQNIVPPYSERLTTLPKPKVSNKLGASPAFTGTKPPLPVDSAPKSAGAAVQIGSASRTFADEGGKTPSQLWAERKARERGQDITSTSSQPSSNAEPPIQSEHSGTGEWKSSYGGKTWAPVQTTHTGRSVGSNASHQADFVANASPETPLELPQQTVSSIRDQFSHEPPKDTYSDDNPIDSPDMRHTVPPSSLPQGPTKLESHEQQTQEAQESTPTLPRQPRSPTPPTPARESSPIRVAMPVGRGVTSDYDEHQPTSAIPAEGLQHTVPNDTELEDKLPNTDSAAAQVTANTHQSEGIQAIVQYDYDKAEDNEIELKEGEYVTDIEMVDKDWWLGSSARGERGLFPSNYVELIEHNRQAHTPIQVHEPEFERQESHPKPNAPSTQNQAHGPTATALYDYEAAEDNELSFPEGAEITNIEFPDDDWWLGKYHGKKGLFPANYVQLGK